MRGATRLATSAFVDDWDVASQEVPGRSRDRTASAHRTTVASSSRAARSQCTWTDQCEAHWDAA
eukprot:6475889-Pyramimonas_sp.AAC.1